MFRKPQLCSRNCFVKWRRTSESFVERTLAIPLQIQGDISEARGFEALGNRRGHFLRQRARHFVLRNFDACEVVVDAHSKLAKAEFAKSGFTALDEGEPLGSDFCTV